MSPLRLAVFDCDGTLADSQHAIAHAMAAAFDAFGQPPPLIAAVRALVGLPLETVLERLLPPPARAERDAIAVHYRALLREHLETPDGLPPLYEGIADLVRRLDGDEVLLGICTGRSRSSLTQILVGHGLAGHFVTLQTGDRHPGKPHPGMLEAALDEAGVEAGDAVMVGDTGFDMEMARNAGVAAVGVAWGYHAPEELAAAGAVHVAGDAVELSAVLDEILAS